MTLADDIHVGDTVTIKPSWVVKEDHRDQVKPEQATVEYIHPAGRYCTVRFANGTTDSIPLTRADRVAVLDDWPEAYKPVKNKYLRDQLRHLHVRQQDIGLAMGRSKSYISDLLAKDMTCEKQKEILRVAKQIAASRSRKSP